MDFLTSYFHFKILNRNYLACFLFIIFPVMVIQAQPKQELIYENSFNKSMEEWKEEMKNDWVLEGKGIIESGDGYLSMRSEIFTVPRDRDGHFNLWLKKDFPANVAYEWEFQYSEPGDQGLAIIIWGAKGKNGEDIFDPALPPRRGEVMSDFHSGA